MSSTRASPSFLSLATLFSGIICSALTRAVTSPFSSRRAPTYFQDVFFAAVRTFLNLKTIAQSRYLEPSTTERYLALCKSKREEPNTLRVDHKDGNVAAHWIGSPDADVVLLYLHGGGYTQPCALGHAEYLHRLVTDLNSSAQSKSFAILLVAYSLAPEATHPIPLKEATAVLSYLLDKGGKSPSNILVSGDSAGGGLAFSLLSHLLHPHPQVPEVKLSEPLLGAFIYSPWVSFRTDHDSYKRNAVTDTLSTRALRCWALMYAGKPEADPERDPGYDARGDSYSEPGSNDANWWRGLHRIVGGVLIWAGGNEVFVDGIREFNDTLCKGWLAGGGDAERVQYIESPKEAHIQPIMDVMMNANTKGEAQIAIEAWVKALLAS